MTALFVAGIVTGAIPGLDQAYSSSLLSVCAIVAYIRTWIRIGDEQPWLARIGWILFPKSLVSIVALSLQLIVPGEPSVLWPSKILLLSIVGLALVDMHYSWLLIAVAVAMQGMSGPLAIAAAVATGIGFSRFGHPAVAAAGLTVIARALIRSQQMRVLPDSWLLAILRYSALDNR